MLAEIDLARRPGENRPERAWAKESNPIAADPGIAQAEEKMGQSYHDPNRSISGFSTLAILRYLHLS